MVHFLYKIKNIYKHFLGINFKIKNYLLKILLTKN